MERGIKMINKLFAKFFKPIVPQKEKLDEIKKVNGSNGKKIDTMIQKINGSKFIIVEVLHANTRTKS